MRQTRATNELEPIRKNRCELKLVADYAFFKLIGQGNYANAARYLVRKVAKKKRPIVSKICFFRLI